MGFFFCFGGEDWTDVDIIGAFGLCPFGLLRVVRRKADNPIWKKLASLREREVALTQVNAVGINRLRNAMKYSRYFSTICVTLSDTGWIAGVGAKRGADVREIDEHAELVVIWGGNPVNTQVNVMTHAMKAKKRGAKLVVVDPYRTGTADQADIHLAVRPGTDGALAVGVMHVLFKEGYADWDYLRKYTDAPDELAAHVASRTPEWASKITGLPVEEIVSFARLYGQSKASFIRCHHGFSRSRNGAANMHAVTCLPAVTGAWQYKGGGALYGHTGMYPVNKTLITPHTAGNDDTGFWKNLDWDKAIPVGMKDSGAPYSGKFDFIKTEMSWPITHMVAPKEKALGCAECHSKESRLAGIQGIYIPVRDNNKLLDTIGWSVVFLTLLGVFGHGAIRIVTARRH